MGQSKPSASKKNNNNNSGKKKAPATTKTQLKYVDQDNIPPLTTSYNDLIRPLLDEIDKLRKLEVMKEGIQLPTIVVVGDQSSGKSSVLESLAGISLPRGQGICTRVPLIMRLQHHSDPNPLLSLEYMDKVLHTNEADVSGAINSATQEILGSAKGISNKPITLVMKKKGVPDLTMVDLPGVPVHGQRENIYDQTIRDIIMEYIKPEESIILNVLSATVDFSTCESIMMSQSVDKSGKRTLAVVTKADKAPEGLLEKVTNDYVSIGLGYVCVRNRIGEETYEEARLNEKKLFQSHTLLSKIDVSIVGIPVLAQRLISIQAHIISKCLPNIIEQINDKTNANVAELNNIPKNLSYVAEATAVFMQIMGSAKESLRKILIRGEYDEYSGDRDMHCTARLAEMLKGFSDELQSMKTNAENDDAFLMKEVRVLEETNGIGLPNFLPRSGFLTILHCNVKGIANNPVDFVKNVWAYIENVVVQVLMQHCDNYPQLQPSMRMAANNLMSKMKDQSVQRVTEMVEMEETANYTCQPEYMTVWNDLMKCQDLFMQVIEDHSECSKITMEEFGEVEIGHLRNYKHLAQQALDMKMRMTAYWRIVLRRLVDSMALHLLFTIQKLVNKELEVEIVEKLMGPYGAGIERMLEEPPAIAAKRDSLNKSIKLLKESKDVVSKIMDKIAHTK